MARSDGLFRSRLAVLTLVALSQAGREGLSLRGIARAVGATDSSVQRALAVLKDAALVSRSGARYSLRSSPVLEELLVVALDHLPRRQALRVLAAANPAVEFASVLRFGDGLELIAVIDERADPHAAAALRRAMLAIRGQPRVRLTSELHDELVSGLREPDSPAQALRQRALRGERLKGDGARSLPDRARPRRPRPGMRSLHRPHPSLRLPQAFALRALARRFQIERIALFGSGARTDFSPESDVDVAVRYRRGKHRDLYEEVQLEDALEEIFGRDVDLVVEDDVTEQVRSRVLEERVSLYG